MEIEFCCTGIEHYCNVGYIKLTDHQITSKDGLVNFQWCPCCGEQTVILEAGAT